MYLDPGSGSLILQMALAALLGIGVVVRLSWKKISSLFGKKQIEENPAGDDVDTHEESK